MLKIGGGYMQNKTFAKRLQKCFRAVDFPWLYSRRLPAATPWKNVLQMFYFTCNQGLTDALFQAVNCCLCPTQTRRVSRFSTGHVICSRDMLRVRPRLAMSLVRRSFAAIQSALEHRSFRLALHACISTTPHVYRDCFTYVFEKHLTTEFPTFLYVSTNEFTSQTQMQNMLPGGLSEFQSY